MSKIKDAIIALAEAFSNEENLDAGDIAAAITLAASKYSASAVPLATGTKVGGVKAVAGGEGDTVEAKIKSGKLYVPAYPKSAAQADSTAADAAGIVTDFNALLAKLRAAGLLATE